MDLEEVDKYLDIYFELRPQLERPEKGPFGYEIPHVIRAAMAKLIEEKEQTSDALKSVDNMLHEIIMPVYYKHQPVPDPQQLEIQRIKRKVDDAILINTFGKQ